MKYRYGCALVKGSLTSVAHVMLKHPDWDVVSTRYNEVLSRTEVLYRTGMPEADMDIMKDRKCCHCRKVIPPSDQYRHESVEEVMFPVCGDCLTVLFSGEW